MTDGEEVQKKSKRQEKVIKELETVAANARVKDWTVSQDDIHFCVSMLDKHEQVSVIETVQSAHESPCLTYFIVFLMLK